MRNGKTVSRRMLELGFDAEEHDEQVHDALDRIEELDLQVRSLTAMNKSLREELEKQTEQMRQLVQALHKASTP